MNKQDQATMSTEIDKFSFGLEEEFAMFSTIPLGERGGDMDL